VLKSPDVKYDLVSADYKRDPRPSLARMQTQGEVIRAKFPFIGETHLVVSHAGVTEMLKDSRRFVQRPQNAGVKRRIGLQWWMPRTVKALGNSMIGQDDPEHRRLRGLVDEAFTRRGVEVLRGRIEDIADGLLDNMAHVPQPDLVELYARRLPLMVIAELLGLPEEDHDKLHTWAQSFINGTSLAAIAMGVPRILRMSRYLREKIRAARTAPRPGLLRELIAAEENGDRLNDDEMLAMVFLLFFAGHETTTHLISVGTLTLLKHEQTRERLIAEPALWPRAVEELLRWCSTVEITKPRYVAEAGEFRGVLLGRGQIIFAGLAAANYDPEVFVDPERFDIDRDPNPHLAFGSGVHFCLGHQLARLEGQIAFERLLDRYPELALAVPETELLWKPNLGIRGLNALPVRFRH